MQDYDAESISSCQAAEDVELGSRSTSATIFTRMTPTIDLPTPTSDSFGFGGSSVSAHLWGRQAQLKHARSLDESQSDDPSQSDFSDNTLALGFDDDDAEFVGELESVYSAFADLSMSMSTSSAGGPVRLSTLYSTDDIMSDTESVMDPHLHAGPMCLPPTRARARMAVKFVPAPPTRTQWQRDRVGCRW